MIVCPLCAGAPWAWGRPGVLACGCGAVVFEHNPRMPSMFAESWRLSLPEGTVSLDASGRVWTVASGRDCSLTRSSVVVRREEFVLEEARAWLAVRGVLES